MMRRDAHLPSKSRNRNKTITGRGPVDYEESEELTPPTRPSSPRTVSPYLRELFKKRGSDREDALAMIIKRLTKRLEIDVLEKNFATFLYRCLNSIKKGSTREMQLSIRVIDLLAIIVSCQDKVSEMYRELLPVLSNALKVGPNTLKILECLAIVAFFGATNSEETESAMQIIWKFINPESGYDANVKKHSAEVLVAAIYAWLFLLTSMEGWRLSHNYWKGAISYFSNLLEHEDKLVCGAASKALALIYETDSLEKFWSEAKDSSLIKYSHSQQLLRESILKKFRKSENTAKEVREVVKYFESCCCPGACVTVKGKTLTLSSWSQIIQLQFLKSFLADGFAKHMEENEKLQDLFEFNPRENNYLGQELYVSTIDEITGRVFLLEARDPEKITKEERKKERVERFSRIHKGRTQIMSKRRLLSQELKSCSSDFF